MLPLLQKSGHRPSGAPHMPEQLEKLHEAPFGLVFALQWSPCERHAFSKNRSQWSPGGGGASFPQTALQGQ
jgi:hypothetical protein